MSVVLRLCVAALLFAACPSCKREAGPKPAAGPGGDPGNRFAASLNMPTVEVANGQGVVVVSAAESFALIVPNKTDLSAGTVKVYTSATGDFARDGQLVTDYAGPLGDSVPFHVLGHTIGLGYGSASSTYAEIGMGEKGVGIALTPTVDVKQIRVGSLRYEWATPPDEAALREFLKGER